MVINQKVSVIDYGLGNIYSIANILSYCGAEMTLTNSPSEVARAERVILPGVGAFKDGMDGLRRHCLVETIQEFARKERPLLGICLGMQMLLEVSEEFGEHQGLGLIPGRVIPIPPRGSDGKTYKVPHIGWSGLEPSAGRHWQGTVLQDLTPGTAVYFVHSFMAATEHAEHRLADTFYHGQRILAAISRGYLCGTQFHPEKSGNNGVKIINNFLRV